MMDHRDVLKRFGKNLNHLFADFRKTTEDETIQPGPEQCTCNARVSASSTVICGGRGDDVQALPDLFDGIRQPGGVRAWFI